MWKINSDRTELNVGYDVLDVNGNGVTYTISDGSSVNDTFVSTGNADQDKKSKNYSG